MYKRAIQQLPEVSANVQRTFAHLRSGSTTSRPQASQQKGPRGGAASSTFNGQRDTRKSEEKTSILAELRRVLSPEACGWLETSMLISGMTVKGKRDEASTEARPAGHALS